MERRAKGEAARGRAGKGGVVLAPVPIGLALVVDGGERVGRDAIQPIHPDMVIECNQH